MNVFVVIKCGLVDAYNFINQISAVEKVNQVTVFRDEVSLPCEKTVYVTNNGSVSVLKFVKRMMNIINLRSKRPAIIIGIYEIPHGLIAVVTGKLLGVPTVVSIIGNPAYKKIRKGLRLKLTNWILRNSSYITVTGNNSRNYLLSCGYDQKKVIVLPNTMDFAPFTNLNSPKKYDIVSLGRISEEKRLDILLHVVRRVKEYKPDIKVAIGGRGPEFEKIKNLIKEQGLEGNIEMFGFVPDEDLNAFFNAGSIFVLTSETEGFPRTITQAAACGLPVVASDVGDVTDVISDGQDGFVIAKYDNIEDYAEKIRILLTDKKLYNNFSQRLNEKVRKVFNTENASAVWSGIFETANKINT